MECIDLIPSSYRHEHAVRQTLRIVLAALTAILTIGFMLWLLLSWKLHASEANLEQQQTHAGHVIKAHQELSQLADRHAVLEKELALLHALRGQGEVLRVLQGLDVALNENVWLTGMQFERNRKKTDPTTLAQDDDRADANLTFIEHGAEKWSLHRQLHLHGMATSYEALADFIQALGTQPGITDVRFLNSSSRMRENAQIVEFSASASILAMPAVLP